MTLGRTETGGQASFLIHKRVAAQERSLLTGVHAPEKKAAMAKQILGRVAITSLVMIPLLMLAFCGGKDRTDPEKYAEICAEVVDCDPQFKNPPAGIPTGTDLTAVCKKQLADLNDRNSDKAEEVVQCVQAQSCDEKNFMGCMTQSLQGLIPMPQ